MSEERNTLNIYILDKEYRVSCPPEEQQSLRESAEYLDKRMRDIRGGGKILGSERIAVIAALNITHELLRASGRMSEEKAVRDRLQQLVGRIDDVFAQIPVNS